MNMTPGQRAALAKINNPIEPNHYKGSIECIDAIAEVVDVREFCIGNVIKYVWRYKNKNGLEDLKKAQWYLNRAIREIENDSAGTSNDS